MILTVLGTLRQFLTKHWFALSSSMQHIFGIPIMKPRLNRWRRSRGQLPGGPAEDGETPVAICLSGNSGDQQETVFLNLLLQDHSCTVSLDKDKYLTPAPHLRRTRASYESQYTRYPAHSDALKNSFSPGLFPCGIVFPLQWSHLRPLRSLRPMFRLLVLVQRYVF